MAYGLPSWLGGSSSTSPESTIKSPPRSDDGGFIAPDRNKREHCYEGRDAFFRCLDRNNILDATKSDAEAREKCGPEMEAFEGNCAKSWIKYFKDKRVMEYNRDQTIAKIQADDAKAAARAKSDKKGGGWFS